MNTPSSSLPENAPVKPAGETFVWVTAMGLAIGLLMILFLLGLILRNGVSVFWPKPVSLVEFDPQGPTRFQNGARALGIITLEQNRDPRDLTPEQRDSPNPLHRREKQLFMGNRDAFGQAFAFFNAGDILSVTHPPDVIKAERIEWGDALFFPLRIQKPDGTLLPADHPDFDPTMKRLVREGNQRRDQINHIERYQIGRINLRMRDLELEERFYTRKESLTASEELALASLRERIASLRADYEPLARQAGDLRRQQNDILLHYQLVTGQERSLPLANIIHYTYPNRLTLGGKTREFTHHLWAFLSGYPREANTEGGIFPAIFGTFVMTLLMSVAVMPFGVMAAIYLREYAKQGPFVRSVRIAINNLAGVPSIVFGIFGLGFFVYFVGGGIDRMFYAKALPTPTFGTGGILWASLTLALMTVPVVIVATEEALAAVSRGVRESSLACGASKWQTIHHLVLPAAAPGILTGLVLAMARGAGEVAPLMLVGVVALAPNLPIDGIFPFIHLERKFMHLGFHIYDLGFQSPDSEAAKPMVFATTLVLILLVVILNLTAILVRNHLRKKYSAAAF
ncbi:MAG TPA: phosphate ABC transporter permease PstA [Kiritimatiellia bacterium]|nr:phosphate ABC transporter permease PstA [Kiritimatiellia bacterium]